MPDRYERFRTELDEATLARIRAAVRAERELQLRRAPPPQPKEHLLMPQPPARPDRTRVVTLAAACVAVLIGGVVAIAALTGGDDPDPPAVADRPAQTTAEQAPSATTTAPPTDPPVETVEVTAAPALPDPTQPIDSGMRNRTIADLPASTPIEAASVNIEQLAYDPAYANSSDDTLWITRWIDGGLDRRRLSDLTSLGEIADVQNHGSDYIVRPSIGFGSVWTITYDKVFRIDEESGTIAAEIVLPGSTANLYGRISELAVGPDGVWTLAHTDTGSVAVRIDPTSGTIATSVPVEGIPSSLTYLEGSLWVSHEGEMRIDQIDPVTGEVRSMVQLDFVPLNVRSADTTVWVLGQQVGSGNDPLLPRGNWVVGRIDAQGQELVATTEIYDSPGTSMLLAERDMATAASSLWITTPDGVARLDAATGVVTNVYSGTSDGGVAVSPDAAWVVDKLDRMLYQLPLDG